MDWKLRDIAHEFLPRMPDKYHDIGNWPKNYLDGSFWTMTVFTLFRNRRGIEKPHIVNLILRNWEMMTIGSIMRFTVYIVTTLPGAVDACFGEWENWASPKPSTFSEIFTRRQIGHINGHTF